MDEVIPLLRALNALIIQYRNRVVRVIKSGPQLMTRLRLFFQILNEYIILYHLFLRGWGKRHQPSDLIDLRLKKKDTEFYSSPECRNLDTLRHLCKSFLNDEFRKIKANIQDIQKQMEDIALHLNQL